MTLADDRRRGLVFMTARAARRFDIAAALWTEAAESGDTDAMINVGAMYAQLENASGLGPGPMKLEGVVASLESFDAVQAWVPLDSEA
ncbi:hypothetical protein ABIA32_003743 [Streptacidiphilus sp. MAP12-20]|uniref:hypothetical protein n=1 Tax=Streptacidiphilus sp. MAP12-20 TaxID=3156299 RepID=UPI0035146804